METRQTFFYAWFLLVLMGCEGQFLLNLDESESALVCENVSECEPRQCQVASCTDRCEWEPIVVCLGGDGCCPAGCTGDEDDDCNSSCGNGVIESGETCDGDCPSSCDGDSCSVSALQGSPESCNVMCVVSSTITACVDGDGCCPSGCDSSSDSDCIIDCMNLASWPPNWGSLEDEVIALVNARRGAPQNCGIYGNFPAVGPVSMGDDMRKASRCHSQDMGTRNRIGHSGSDGSNFSQRLVAAGYSGQPLGENVAAGQSSASDVVGGWMRSDGHCRNIMNGSVNKMGIGYHFEQNSTFRHWWTMKTGVGGN